MKPEKPSNLALRGVNSDTFDVDVGAVRKTKERNPMDINGNCLFCYNILAILVFGFSLSLRFYKIIYLQGYRFEIIESEKFRLDGRKWDHARIMILGFEDGMVRSNSHKTKVFNLAKLTGITYLINNLVANTSYLVRVASKNPAGLSDWTGPREFHTTPKEPLGLMPNSNSATGLLLSYFTCQCFLVSTFTFLISNIVFLPSIHTRLLVMT